LYFMKLLPDRRPLKSLRPDTASRYGEFGGSMKRVAVRQTLLAGADAAF